MTNFFSNHDIRQVSRTDQYGFQKGIDNDFGSTRKGKNGQFDGSEESPVHVVIQSQKGKLWFYTLSVDLPVPPRYVIYSQK